MNDPGFFQSALVYLTAAVISVPVAKRLGLGSVLGYLAAGVLIGPFALGLVGGGQDHAGVMHIAESGVVVMLFLIGLELKLPALWKMRGALLGLGGLQVLGTGLALGLVGLAAGWPAKSAFVCGFILSLSSTAIVLQSLREKALHGTAGGRHAFATLLFQDIAVIPMLAILPLLAVVPATSGTSPPLAMTGWLQGLAVLAAIVGVIAAGRWLLPVAFGYIARSGLREIFTAMALLVVLAVGALMVQVGLSPALGAFIAGVVLAGSPYRHELESDLEPFKGLLLGLFFISVGASMDLPLIAANPGGVLALLGAFVIIKGLVLFGLGKLFRFSGPTTALYVASMFQGGEFAFVLFGQSATFGLLDATQAGMLNAVVALSMAMTPVALLIYQAADCRRCGRTPDAKDGPEPDPEMVDEHAPVILAGFGRFGNFVGRLFRAHGIPIVVLESDAEHVELTRRLGMDVHYGDATRVDVLRAAGAESARLLIIALDDEEAIDRLVAETRKHFPHLELIVRAKGMDHRLRLLEAGVTHVYHEMVGSALDAGSQALRLLGIPAYPAERSARRFRRWDMTSARELAPLRAKDEAAYFSRVRERVADLETLFRNDPDAASSNDAAWQAAKPKKESPK